MKLVEANKAPKQMLANFLNHNDHLESDRLIASGYVAIKQEEIVGCFILDSVEEGLFWLKQLYITQSAAMNLPVLLEAILVLAKQKYAKEVYVHSHQPMVDILLEGLQFHRKPVDSIIKQLSDQKGTWWAYQVS